MLTAWLSVFVPRRRVVYDHVCRPIRAGTPSSFPRQSPSTCPACPLTDTSHYLSQCFGFAFWARFTIGRRYPGRAASCWGVLVAAVDVCSVYR